MQYKMQNTSYSDPAAFSNTVRMAVLIAVTIGGLFASQWVIGYERKQVCENQMMPDLRRSTSRR